MAGTSDPASVPNDVLPRAFVDSSSLMAACLSTTGAAYDLLEAGNHGRVELIVSQFRDPAERFQPLEGSVIWISGMRRRDARSYDSLTNLLSSSLITKYAGLGFIASSNNVASAFC